MDPYVTLGVPKGCNREEVKEAFRVRAQYAHPDRGGEVLSFIELRTAYEQILAELDQDLDPNAAPRKSAGDPRDEGRPMPPGSRFVGETYASWFRHVAVQADRGQSVWSSPRIRAIGIMILLGLIIVNLTAFWMIWTRDGQPPGAPIARSRRWTDSRCRMRPPRPSVSQAIGSGRGSGRQGRHTPRISS